MADLPNDAVDKDDEDGPPAKSRGDDLASKKSVREKLLKLQEKIEKGFEEQFERSEDIADYWDLYNCKLGPKQFYAGNAQIFVPIVYEAVTARKTRFGNQLFPQSGRYVECTSEDGTLPQSITSLAEHYVRKAHLRTLIPSLLVNGDVEGQYSIYVNWSERKRYVVEKVRKPVELEPGVETDDHVDDVTDETEIRASHPEIEILSDADLLVLPQTAASLEDAIWSGGSVTVLRRWSKEKIEELIAEKQIKESVGKSLIEAMGKPDAPMRTDQAKKNVRAAGIKSDGRGKFALVYETWSMVKTDEGLRLCRTFLGGPDKVLSCHRNPFWCDRLPIISTPVNRIAGAFKGQSLMSNGIDSLQYQANDFINEAADSATYSLMPIIMTDPEKNPRVGSMVLSLAAVWQVDPNSTKFAEFPQLWKEGMELVAGVKQEIFQALSVNPAMITAGSKAKKSQAEIANEQQVDLLTTADAVTTIEEGILTPMIRLFVELDHQYRDEQISVRSFGEMGLKADMQEIPPLQNDRRYAFRWYGVEAARNAQQVQQQIAGINVLMKIPPQMYQGYKLDLTAVITQLAENTFGPRLAPLTFQKLEPPITPEMEVEMASEGIETPVSPFANHQQAMQLLIRAIQSTRDPSGVLKQQLMKHQQIMMQQAQAQQQAQSGQQAPGGPNNAGPKPGAQPQAPRGGQQPPGSIHADRMPLSMPRKT